jgi:hypothetical protein
MKIFEIFNPGFEEAFSPSYDLADDLQYFMNNDPEFYRKNYYPFVMKVKEAKVNKTKFTAKAFEAMVNHAYKVYKETFTEEKNLPNELDEELVKEICENLHRQELKNIEEGHYDDIN